MSTRQQTHSLCVCTRANTETSTSTVFVSLLDRIKDEYRDMPGLSLTQSQACRLWHVDGTICAAVLGSLSDTSFLRVTSKGMFVRVDSATLPRSPRVGGMHGPCSSLSPDVTKG
jgi:hypothetical protein